MAIIQNFSNKICLSVGTGTVVDTFKTKNTTFLNLKFCESFPVKFWNSEKLTKVKDFSRFAQLLKASEKELDS